LSIEVSSKANNLPDLRNPQIMKSAMESVKRVHELLKPELDALNKELPNQSVVTSSLSQEYKDEIRTFSKRPISTEIRECPFFLF